jgi:hypothetical protein
MGAKDCFIVLKNKRCYYYKLLNGVISAASGKTDGRVFEIRYCDLTHAIIHLYINYQESENVPYEGSITLSHYGNTYKVKLEKFDRPRINTKLSDWFTGFTTEPSTETLAIGLTKVFDFIEAVQDSAEEIVHCIDAPGKRATFF